MFVFCVCWLTLNIVFPVVGYGIYGSEYKELSSKCADAMDETWFVEQLKDEQLNVSSKIHLMNCHEYDKTRKIMLSLGVSEHLLSYLNLEALELNQISVDRFVEQHRFNER